MQKAGLEVGLLQSIKTIVKNAPLECYGNARKERAVQIERTQNDYKQLLDEVFVISRIIKVEVRVIIERKKKELVFLLLH